MNPAASSDLDLTAAEVAWDLEPLLDGRAVTELLDEADALAEQLVQDRGRVGDLSAAELIDHMNTQARLSELIGRTGSYAGLRFSVDTTDHGRAALMQQVEERSVACSTRLLFFELEWAQLDDAHAEALLADPGLDFCAHHLRSVRRYRDHLLTEPEERIVAEMGQSGSSAWERLFEEQASAITIELPEPDGTVVTTSLEQGLSRLGHPDREVRQAAAAAVTAGLQPGLRTRAFIFNTLLLDKATQDRLRNYPTWVSSMNLANEASDASVQALVEAVVGRYDIPQTWYRLKAQVLGLERLADFDRNASVAQSETLIGWGEAGDIVLDAYRSFSPRLADIASEFLTQGWIDAPVRAGKRPGAFCAYTVAGHHPYVLLNWTSRNRDVLTLAHELGHGLHAYLARPQGDFHQGTPLTLAETASVFGETITNNRMLAQLTDPGERFALLAATLEDSIATVFRQVAMNRFEEAVHTARRESGELSVDHIGELWTATQTEMLGDGVEITDGYASWWSYIPHFIGSPGYVYAYAYGQLLALSVYARYEEQGEAFVPRYLELLSAGGSLPPAELGRIVDCDLEDPGFWDAGLNIVSKKLEAATEAARAAGRLG